MRRAWILLAAMGVSLLRRRISGRLAPLFVAAALLLAWEPGALFLAGAQMSFVASAALLLASGRAAGLTSRPGGSGPLRVFGSALYASATAILVTLPLAAIHLGVASQVGLLANAVAVPWTGGVLLPAALIAGVAVVMAPGSGFKTLVVGVASALASFTPDACATLAQRFPDATLVPPGPGVWILAAASTLLAVSRAGLAVRVLAALLLPVLVVALPSKSLSPEPPRVVFLDVGRSRQAPEDRAESSLRMGRSHRLRPHGRRPRRTEEESD